MRYHQPIPDQALDLQDDISESIGNWNAIIAVTWQDFVALDLIKTFVSAAGQPPVSFYANGPRMLLTCLCIPNTIFWFSSVYLGFGIEAVCGEPAGGAAAQPR